MAYVTFAKFLGVSMPGPTTIPASGGTVVTYVHVRDDLSGFGQWPNEGFSSVYIGFAWPRFEGTLETTGRAPELVSGNSLDGTWKIVRVTDQPVKVTTFQHKVGKGETRFWIVAVDALGQEGQPSAPAWFNRSYRGFYEVKTREGRTVQVGDGTELGLEVLREFLGECEKSACMSRDISA